MTGCSHTDINGIFSLRFQAEGVEKGRQAQNPAEGNIQLLGNLLDGLFGQVSEFFLDILEDGDYGAWSASYFPKISVNFSWFIFASLGCLNSFYMFL